jgi:hypothetical protein
VVPNDFVIQLAHEDLERFASFHDSLVKELADAAREHAREEGYHFIGPVEVEVVEAPGAKRGDLVVTATIREGPEGAVGALVLPDGRRVQLGDQQAIIGRMPDCAVALSDPQVSRQHAAVRPTEHGYEVVDLGSTNGTLVNGHVVREHPLTDGDVIMIGATSIRYEES